MDGDLERDFEFVVERCPETPALFEVFRFSSISPLPSVAVDILFGDLFPVDDDALEDAIEEGWWP